MTIDRVLRGMAGFFVMVSLALGYWVHPGWFLFTGFVGLNLFQSAFSNTCPAMVVLRRLGVRECPHAAGPGAGFESEARASAGR